MSGRFLTDLSSTTHAATVAAATLTISNPSPMPKIYGEAKGRARELSVLVAAIVDIHSMTH